jgi:ABC-type Mn2+/Zn2+ transport system permease subunit
MKTLEYLSDPSLRSLFVPALVASVALAVMCSLLSVLVVLKRMAFIGQGISHAAFGGIGIAVALGVAGSSSPRDAFLTFLIVLVFCLGSGVLIAALTGRGGQPSPRSAGKEPDTIIGVVLVGAMSLGAVLLHLFSTRAVSWETFLFGDILSVGVFDAVLAWVLALATIAVLFLTRRKLIFWAFDGATARAMGVPDRLMQLLLLLLLSLATVTAMKLAGVVLATALLVLPGATALRCSGKLSTVLLLSGVFSIVGVLGGIVLSFERDWLPGASIVLLMCTFYIAALLIRRT